MIKPRTILAAILLALPLAACGDKQKETQAQAGGEILPGSISDEMLPMDTATSKPPLAPKAAADSGDADDKEDQKSEGGNAANSSDPAEKAPAQKPAAAEGE